MRPQLVHGRIWLGPGRALFFPQDRPPRSVLGHPEMTPARFELMKDLRVRRMVAADAAAVAALSQKLGYEASFREVCGRIGDLETNSLAVAYVAVVDGVVAGWIQAHDRRLLQYPRVLEIGGVVIAEDLMGEGVGRQLVEAVCTWGRARGHDRLWARSNIQRSGAHDFYESIGFVREKNSYAFSRLND